jgi:hypothetical protein
MGGGCSGAVRSAVGGHRRRRGWQVQGGAARVESARSRSPQRRSGQRARGEREKSKPAAASARGAGCSWLLPRSGAVRVDRGDVRRREACVRVRVAARPRRSTRLPKLSLHARVLAGDRYGARLLGFPACKLQFSTPYCSLWPWLGSLASKEDF